MEEEIQDKIAEIFNNIDIRILNLQKDIQNTSLKKSTKSARWRAKQVAEKYKHNFRLLLDSKDNWDDLFHFYIRDVKESPYKNQSRRIKTLSYSKRKVCQALVKSRGYRQKLYRMGLKKEHLRLMNGNTMPLDMSIDHEIPQNYGGSGELDNCRAIPSYLNNLFNYFADYQRQALRSKRILMLRFNEIGLLPYVPDGFRKKIEPFKKDLEVKSSKLFGCDFRFQ